MEQAISVTTPLITKQMAILSNLQSALYSISCAYVKAITRKPQRSNSKPKKKNTYNITQIVLVLLVISLFLNYVGKITAFIWYMQ